MWMCVFDILNGAGLLKSFLWFTFHRWVVVAFYCIRLICVPFRLVIIIKINITHLFLREF